MEGDLLFYKIALVYKEHSSRGFVFSQKSAICPLSVRPKGLPNEDSDDSPSDPGNVIIYRNQELKLAIAMRLLRKRI